MFDIVPVLNTNLYRFILKAKNGEILLTSITFTTIEEAQLAIEQCKTFAGTKTNFERKTAANGKFHFILKNKLGYTLANSQFYSSEAGMQNGIEAVRKYTIGTAIS